MINATFLVNESGSILGFQISGHANYSNSQPDVICAAVSSAAYMATNTITDIIKIAADVSVDNSGKMFLKIKKDDYNPCKDILQGLKLHLIALEELYPENIVVNYMEV